MSFFEQPPPGIAGEEITNLPQSAIQATNLIKQFGNFTAVQGVNFTVARGECFGLLGPNGAGKTSIVKMIYGFSPVTSGSLFVLGNDISAQARRIKNKIGVVAQNDNLDPELTVRDNLLVYAGFFRLPKQAARKRTDEILKFMDLADKSNDIVENLSGGMQRRLTIGRALINRPELLILDEPTTGLDPHARRLVWQRLRKLKESGTTMLLTTHYLEEATQLCDRLIILHRGQIIAEGTPQALIDCHVGKEALEIAFARTDRPVSVQPVYAQSGDKTDLSGPGFPLDDENFLPEVRDLLKGSQDMGDNLVLFTDQGQALSDRVKAWATARGLHITDHRLRPTNLEDVFLKLTGATLAESQGPEEHHPDSQWG